ncbi:MAG TPA: hypothetical protein PLY70_15495 [Saprospiraceae bacterium]|nr:hypothetical protein [Saprospiraceae bacterium]
MALLVASCGYNHKIYIYHGRTYIKNVILGRHVGLPLQVVPFYISVEKPWHAMAQPPLPFTINN